MKKIVAVFLVGLFAIASVSAQTKLIGMKRAKQIASQRVKGKIKSSELEKEKGKMIYSFDISTGKGQITEVNIDAYTGKIIAVDVENKKDEAKEKAEDAKEMKKKP
jgi:transcriptional regulator of met regulon